SLFEVCDNDSQGMHDLYAILTEGKEVFRPDLRIEEVALHVLFLYGAVFHPSINPYRQGILDAAFRLFGEQSLAVMWKETSGLSEAEMSELGFCKVAGCALILRHSALRTRFGDRHPKGMNTDDAVAEPEWEEWVLKEWRRSEGAVERDAEGGGV